MSELPGALADALGAGLSEHPPLEIDGLGLGATLAPADAPELAAAVQELGRHSLGALLRGGGSQLGIGNPPRRSASLILSTERLRGIDDFDPDEGVCHALAGTPLAELRRALEAEGWELPLEAAGPDSTLGGALAAASVGPRCQGLGRPRDWVLGLEVTLGTGQRVRCGGRVVKNVTGYDLNKIHTGAFGTLGVIEGAWLRLRPQPETTRLLGATLDELDAACRAGVAAARRATARAVALTLPTEASFSLWIELAGAAPDVERDAAALAEACGASSAPADALERVAELQRDASGLRFRLAVPVSRLEAVGDELRRFGAELLVYPGPGLVWARFPLLGKDPRATADAVWTRIARVAREAGASFRLECAPAWAKRGHDVFGETPASLPLMSALKRSFDPQAVLNPGRFAGQL